MQERDADLEFIPITDDGILRLDVFEVLLRLKPKLVAFTHVSNTLGTINPVAEMTRMAHEAGALVLIDGAQAVPHGHGPGQLQRLHHPRRHRRADRRYHRGQTSLRVEAGSPSRWRLRWTLLPGFQLRRVPVIRGMNTAVLSDFSEWYGEYWSRISEAMGVTIVSG